MTDNEESPARASLSLEDLRCLEQYKRDCLDNLEVALSYVRHSMAMMRWALSDYSGPEPTRALTHREELERHANAAVLAEFRKRMGADENPETSEERTP